MSAGNAASSAAEGKLALAGQQAHGARFEHAVVVGGALSAGHRGRDAEPVRLLPRRVAELQVGQQRGVHGGDLGDTGPATLDVQCVEQDPAPGLPGDGDGIGEAPDRAVGGELDDRAYSGCAGRHDEGGQQLGEPSGIGVIADDVEVAGAESRRRFQHALLAGENRSRAERDRLHRVDREAGVRAPPPGLRQHGRPGVQRPGLLVGGDRADAQAHRVEPGRGGQGHQLGRRDLEQGEVFQADRALHTATPH